MLRNSAEGQDLAQETFSRLWAKRADFRDEEATLAWIYRTATRLAVDRIRRNQVAAQVYFRPTNDDPNAVARLEARQELAEVLRRLGKRELQVLLLSRVDGLTHVVTQPIPRPKAWPKHVGSSVAWVIALGRTAIVAAAVVASRLTDGGGDDALVGVEMREQFETSIGRFVVRTTFMV